MSDKPAPIITVDFSRTCGRCGKRGAAPNGLCLRCVAEAVRRGELKPARGRKEKGDD